MHRLWILGLAALQPLQAQERFSVGPIAGLYLAASSFVGPVASDPTASRSYKHAIAPLFGAQATAWLGSRAALGAMIAWSSSDVKEAIGSAPASIPADVTLLAAFVAFRVNSLERDNAFHVRVGVAQVAHGGEFFESLEDTRSLAGLFGIDATLPIGSHLRGGGGIEAYVYSLQLSSSSGQFEKRSLVDAVARVGISWTFGER